MKKFLLLSTLLVTAINISVYAQKFEKEEIDKFNGTKIVKTTTEGLVVSLGYPQVSAYGVYAETKDSASSSYALTFIWRPYFVGSIKNDNAVFLLLQSGEPVELKYMGEYRLFSSGDRIVITCVVEPEQLKMLAEQPITDIRFELSKRVDYSIKKKQQGLIQELCKLLLTKN